MTYKQIETSREVRLWVSSIIVPALIFGTCIVKEPAIRGKIKEKAILIKNKFKK